MQLFNVPLYYPDRYVTGPQPFNPGEPNSSWVNEPRSIWWPNVVGVLNVIIGNPGTPRGYPISPLITGIAPLPSDYLYMRGFVGKSLG